MSKQLRISLAVALLVIVLLFYFRYNLVFHWQQYLIQRISKNAEVDNHTLVDSLTEYPEHRIYTFKGTERLLPHRVNSLQRMQILYPHFKGFECDIRFDKQSGSLHIGHDENDVNQLTFTDYLIADQKQKFFWLDVKNLDAANVDAFLSALEQLDKKYTIKQRIIIESTNINAISKVAEAGYLCSYYVPATEEKQIKELAAAAIHFKGLVSQEYALLPQLMQYFPKHKIATWDINFMASHNSDQLSSYCNNQQILCCMINVKSQHYR